MQLVETLEISGAVTHGLELAEEVMRREREGSTAIGGGLVIPHARYKGVKSMKVAVATLSTPLEIPSEDGQPVDIVILLVGTVQDPRLMLWVLARLARLVKNSDFLDDLRGSQTGAELMEIFARADDQNIN